MSGNSIFTWFTMLRSLGKYHAIIFALSSIRIIGLCSMGYLFDGSSVVSEISCLILFINLRVNCASTVVSKDRRRSEHECHQCAVR